MGHHQMKEGGWGGGGGDLFVMRCITRGHQSDAEWHYVCQPTCVHLSLIATISSVFTMSHPRTVCMDLCQWITVSVLTCEVHQEIYIMVQNIYFDIL